MSSLNYERIAQMPTAFQLFKPSWAAFKLNWAAFIIPVILPIALLVLAAVSLAVNSSHNGNLEQSANGTFTSQVDIRWNIFSIIIGVVGILALIVFSVATSNYVKLQSAKGMKLGVKQAISESLPFFWRLFGLTLWRGFLICGGLVLLIAPGIYLWKRYLLAPYYLMDENVGVFEAMKRAGADSAPFASALWGIVGICVLIQVVGIIPWIGWMISAGAGIAYMCAGAVRYCQIKQIKSLSSVEN